MHERQSRSTGAGVRTLIAALLMVAGVLALSTNTFAVPITSVTPGLTASGNVEFVIAPLVPRPFSDGNVTQAGEIRTRRRPGAVVDPCEGILRDTLSGASTRFSPRGGADTAVCPALHRRRQCGANWTADMQRGHRKHLLVCTEPAVEGGRYASERDRGGL